jgi:glycosyltransferase involved in cell wall biosynthesis
VSRLVKRAGFVLTCTRDGENYLKSIIKPKYHEKIDCIYHGLSLDRYSRTSQNANRGLPIIISAGRFIDKKGFDILLESLHILKKRGIKFNSIIAGDGKLTCEIKALTERLGLKDLVRFPGFVSEKNMIDLYRQGSLFVLPCRESADGNKDGIPNVILEAMASGLPIISTSVGGIPEVVINGQNGFLIRPNNPVELADTIEKIINDKSLVQKMGAEGRKMVSQNFDIEKNGKILFEHFLTKTSLLKDKFSPELRSRVEAGKNQALTRGEL